MNASQLINNPDFRLFKIIEHTEIKAFVKNEMLNRTWLLISIAIMQGVAFVLLGFIIGFAIVISFRTSNFTTLKLLLFSASFSFSVLIIIHELTHALGFIILGKRHIRFGGRLKQFVFYAASHCEILDSKQLAFVAFLPLTLITLTCASAFLWVNSNLFICFFAPMALIHTFFCAGDAVMVSFMARQKNKVYTYDDCDEGRSYFFEQVPE